MAVPYSGTWYTHREQSRWPSVGVAFIATALLFAAALVSMRSASEWNAMVHEQVAAPVRVSLAPPRPTTVPPAERVVAPRNRPSATPALPVIGGAAQLPIEAVPSAAVDTASVRGRVVIPAASGAAATARFGAWPSVSAAVTAYAPAGVTHNSHGARMSASDSALSARFTRPDVWNWHGPPSPAELANLRQSQLLATRVERRATSSSDARDVHIMTGEGLGAAGAVGGGKTGLTSSNGQPIISIPFTLFSSGPSAKQRRRDSVVEASDLALLAVLQARADSLRRARARPR